MEHTLSKALVVAIIVIVVLAMEALAVAFDRSQQANDTATIPERKKLHWAMWYQVAKALALAVTTTALVCIWWHATR